MLGIFVIDLQLSFAYIIENGCDDFFIISVNKKFLTGQGTTWFQLNAKSTFYQSYAL